MATTGATQITFSYNFEFDRSGDGTEAFLTREQRNTGSDSKVSYSNGSGADKIETVYSARRTLTAASGTDDLDLSSLTDPAGQSLNFSSIKAIYVKNREPDASGSNLKLGGAGSNAFNAPFDGSDTAKLNIGPGGEIALTSPKDGWAVITAERILRIENDGGSSGDLDYDIIILGNTS